MDKVQIQNEQLDVSIKIKGAELCSVRDKHSGFEFIWQAQEVWPRHAPNLFPVIGSLLDHEYLYKGTPYALSHHGFARDHDFTFLQQSEHSASFLLEPNASIRSSYPFEFQLIITYTLCEHVLEQRFRVVNKGKEDMPFSLGGHPAFRVDGQRNYRIRLDQEETVPSLCLEGPYVSERTVNVIQKNEIVLSPEVFAHDALIFRGLRSKVVHLEHVHDGHRVSVSIPSWPYLGIWAKPGADFVCIEPWDGLADRVGHDKQILHKEGIRILGSGSSYSNYFNMQFTSP